MNVVINLNKPESLSSHQAVTKVKHFFGAKKAGHTGTLDPLATGVLVICLNEATKIARFLSDLDKEYAFRLRLGQRTDTYDSTGRILEDKDFRVKEAEVEGILGKFIGPIMQIPPMYSALKIGGKTLYKLARKGTSIERPERKVHIYRMDLVSFQPPYLDLKAHCSKGTYIRTLCDDIGKALGVGAHMVSLTRTKVGDFGIEKSLSLDNVHDNKESCHSIDSVLCHLAEIILDKDSYQRAKNGMPVKVNDEMPFNPPKKMNGGPPEKLSKNQHVMLKSPEKVLFGIGRVDDGEIKIERLLNFPSGG